MDPRLVLGIAQFNRGEFFAAHESWEDLWNDSVGDEKMFLKGLIQIAAGYLKAESGIQSAAIKLLSRGSALVKQFSGASIGLNLDEFLAAVETDLRCVQAAHGDQAAAMIVRPPRLG